MRPVILTDLLAAARCLSGLPFDRALAEAARLIDRAHAADRYRKRCGRAHPRLGDGTLAAACGRCGPAPATPEALAAVALALACRRGLVRGVGWSIS